METNNLYYGILLYIIIVALLVFTKPDFIYDHTKSKYKEYGTAGNKTIFTLPILSIILAIFIAIIVVVTGKKEQSQPTQPTQSAQPIVQYVPVYYQTMPQFQSVQYLPQPTQQIQQPIQSASFVTSQLTNELANQPTNLHELSTKIPNQNN